MSNKPRLTVFASGSATGGGSGFQNLVEASRDGRLDAEIVSVISNHEHGGVRQRADKLHVPFWHFPKPWTANAYQRLAWMSEADFFALSGWLKQVKGLNLKTGFNQKTVINIHPGNLPDFGGPGLYGHYVHEAAMAAYSQGRITHSAVCMHFVTAEYDQGPVFFRCRVPIKPNDTSDTLGSSVNDQELIWQPQTTNLVVHEKITWDGRNHDSLQLPEGYVIEHTA